jgi:protein TonB
MSRRKILIGASIAGHAALLAGVLVSGAWDLDQLEHPSRARSTLAVVTPPAADSSAVVGTTVLPVATPPRIVNDLRQPKPQRPEPTPTTGTLGARTGTGPAPGDGPGGGGPEGGDPCQEPGGCEPVAPPPPPRELPKPPPPPPPTIIDVAPQILKALRIRGETAILPPSEVRDQMYRSENYRTIASIKVCIATDGTVSSVRLVRSTTYPAYDEAITSAARRWVYRPYTVNGTPIPACGMVTFQYAMK